MLSYLLEQTVTFFESVARLLFHLCNLLTIITGKVPGNYSLVVLIIILLIAKKRRRLYEG